MDERKKEIIYASIGLLLCVSVFCNAAYITYCSTVEQSIEFKVFEVNCWDANRKVETQVLTWGVGKFYFLGNWTGQFVEGCTYSVTFVHQRGSSLRAHRDLIILSWEEVP